MAALVLSACTEAHVPHVGKRAAAPAPASGVTLTTPTQAAADAGRGVPTPAELLTWQETDLDLHPAGKATPMPLTDAQVAKLDGAESRWARLSGPARDRLRARGFVVVPAPSPLTAPMRFGVFYKELADDNVPYVITLDALTGLAHAAFSRALAEAEDRELAPALGTMLSQLDLRLTAEERGARSDLILPYAMAHGVIAVARALADASYPLPPDLAPVVEAERQRVVAHAAAAESLLTGSMLDYAGFAPRGALEEKDARAGLYRALAWLSHAPFLVLARSEAEGARISVSEARAQTRAALLVARLFDAEVDKEIAKSWATVARVAAFVGGASDDLSPPELSQIALAAGLDVRNAAAIENVVLIDRVRKAAARAHVTRIYDGAGGIVASRAGDFSVDAPFPAASLSMRVVGARAPADAAVLQALVAPRLGHLEAGAAADGGAPRPQRRTLPSGLDVAGWLGSGEAREASRVAGDEAYEGYVATRNALLARRTEAHDDSAARHASLYRSGLDVVSTYLTSSAADGSQPYASTGAWRDRKIEVALNLWTVLRHDSVAFARRSLGQEAAPAVRPSSARGFVEVHPEAIGKLLSLVRQTKTGLARLSSVPKDAPGQRVLAEVETLLTGCLRVALREANDEPLGGDDAALLASLPSRLDLLDARLSRSGEADVPLIVDVHIDVEGARVLEEATGPIDDLYLVVREPGSGRLVLAVGASSAHYEFAQPAALRLTDEAWRARLRAGSAPPRQGFSLAYVADGR